MSNHTQQPVHRQSVRQRPILRQPDRWQPVRLGTALAALALFGTACSASATARSNTSTSTGATASAASSPTSTRPPDASSTSPSAPQTGGADATTVAVDRVKELGSTWNLFVTSAVAGEPDAALAARIAALHDPNMVTVDQAALGTCVATQLQALELDRNDGLWESESRLDSAHVVADPEPLWNFTVMDNLVATTTDGDYDAAAFADVVVGVGGVVQRQPAYSPDDPTSKTASATHIGLVDCLHQASTLSPAGQAVIDRMGSADLPSEPIDVPESADATGPGGDADASDGEGEFADKQRPAFPADPADPEPIGSTGSNTWDLIRADDPTTFDRVEFLGQSDEEFIPASKEGEYEPVADAYLYRAYFSDNTTIDIRVHPEIGTRADADAEVEHYLVPLGQLPKILRADIGRFAIRVGDNTAGASFGEGIMVQTENMATRRADNRLEETLFHESVHTSLDRTYGYQASQGWLDAQAADGRWLTEYGRENPDNEDLAESSLYAWIALYHPDRLPDGMDKTIRDRIPNRIEFIETYIFPTENP